MKKLLLALLAVFVVVAVMLVVKQNQPDIIKIIMQSPDAASFISSNPGYKVSKEILSAKKIEERIIKGDFKEVYQDLILEDQRYIKAELTNGSKGLIVVVDLKEEKVVRVFGLLKIGASFN